MSPFIQRDAGEFRLSAVMNSGKTHNTFPSRDRVRLLDVQQVLEYEMGYPCIIQRKVVTQFNTFSTECWV